MNCDGLLGKKLDWISPLNGWLWHQSIGWLGGYDSYNPWDDDYWAQSVVLYYRGDMDNPSLCQTVRTEAAVLQVIDCLLKQHGCKGDIM